MPRSGADGDEFLELYNTGASNVDLSGWSFSGITLTFAAGTSIAAGGRLVVGKDAARFQLTYGFAPAAVYTGSLSNGGETITLRDAGAATIDSVTYSDRDPWPTTTDGTGPSLELIDPAQDNNDPVNWAASVSLTGAARRVRRTPWPARASTARHVSRGDAHRPRGQPGRDGHRHGHRTDEPGGALHRRLGRSADHADDQPRRRRLHGDAARRGGRAPPEPLPRRGDERGGHLHLPAHRRQRALTRAWSRRTGSRAPSRSSSGSCLTRTTT